MTRIGWHSAHGPAIIGRMTPRSTPRSTPRDASVEAVAGLIESEPTAPHTLESLAGAASLSPSHLRRLFVARYGMTPAAYLRAVRLGAMREDLRAGVAVSAAGFSAGFGSQRAIYEHSTRALGMAPSAYRQGAPGLEIAWDTDTSALGTIVVGATDKGLCCVIFADGSSAQDALASEFPRATLHHDPARVAPHVARLQALLSGDETGEVPLDLIGTPFQRRVWAELRRIPRGQTATYAQIAARIDSPRAVRAVAGACAHNHAAIVVPCHRVIRTDGGLGGYKWGIERKTRLLAEERTR
ncbi:MAG: methylated-DNA--[protein]-cysteine S-methyltransferase [Actinobacteria bacterium]|nr:methylated-DNA--[protein]-cysteine S-methyltransferase [Actinomycetota bacterium]MCG2808298.1 methylated-DNA--[protein]-cysteine S-methyltransferase [Coriobacteriia bacterium]